MINVGVINVIAITIEWFIITVISITNKRPITTQCVVLWMNERVILFIDMNSRWWSLFDELSLTMVSDKDEKEEQEEQEKKGEEKGEEEEEINEMVVMPPLLSTVVSVTNGKATNPPQAFDDEAQQEEETSSRYLNCPKRTTTKLKTLKIRFFCLH